MASIGSNRTTENGDGMNGRFEKGHIPWNKGLKGMHLSPSTEFKTGDKIMEKHPCWKGGVQHMTNDCVYINTRPNERARRPHLVVGNVPAGCVVYHLDGNRHNDSPENLEVITRKELLKRNRRKNE